MIYKSEASSCDIFWFNQKPGIGKLKYSSPHPHSFCHLCLQWDLGQSQHAKLCVIKHAKPFVTHRPNPTWILTHLWLLILEADLCSCLNPMQSCHKRIKNMVAMCAWSECPHFFSRAPPFCFTETRVFFWLYLTPTDLPLGRDVSQLNLWNWYQAGWTHGSQRPPPVCEAALLPAWFLNSHLVSILPKEPSVTLDLHGAEIRTLYSMGRKSADSLLCSSVVWVADEQRIMIRF